MSCKQKMATKLQLYNKAQTTRIFWWKRAQAQGPLGPDPSQHSLAKTFQSGLGAHKFGHERFVKKGNVCMQVIVPASWQDLKSGPEAANTQRTIVNTLYVF